MLKRLFLISRPRFWMYPIGSVLIGIGCSGPLSLQISTFPIIILWLLYFTFPSNIFMYGINDIADTDTDKNNAKKDEYEVRISRNDNRNIIISIIITHIIFLPILFYSSKDVIYLFLVYIIFNILYSLPPVRLKRIPIIDSLSNGIICAAVGLIGYLIAGGTEVAIFAVMAGFLWSTAMHAYSAIPDIEADKKSKVSTIATLLGTKKTLYFCLYIYILIAIIFISNSYPYHSLLTLPYIILILMSINKENKKGDVFSVYKKFPYVTYVVGYLVYLFTILVK